MNKTIFRTDKNAENPFVMMDRRPIENPALSWKAKGILAYLLSRPDNWIVRLGDLVKRSPDGVTAVRAAIKELISAGHITRHEEREGGRFKQYVLIVHEIPSPLIGFPQAEKPHAENPTLNNTNNNKNEVKNIKPPAAVSATVIAKANKTVDAILSQAANAKWKGRELIREDLLVFADWYNATTGQVMNKRVQPSWFKALQAWKDEGLDLDDLQGAYDRARQWRIISDPNQLTKDAAAIKAARAIQPQPAQPARKFPKLVNGKLIEE